MQDFEGFFMRFEQKKCLKSCLPNGRVCPISALKKSVRSCKIIVDNLLSWQWRRAAGIRGVRRKRRRLEELSPIHGESELQAKVFGWRLFSFFGAAP